MTEAKKDDTVKPQTPEVVEAEIVDEEESTQWSERLLSVSHWLRFLFMVLFAVIAGVASYVMTALVVLQFLWALITGEGNDKLRSFGSSLSQYIYQIMRFLTYNTDDKPFPFADWPETDLKIETSPSKKSNRGLYSLTTVEGEVSMICLRSDMIFPNTAVSTLPTTTLVTKISKG